MRFIINLPQEELESVERICFQVEEAQWFYEDFIRPLDPDLPSLNLRNFCLRIFQHCPLLSQFSSYHHSTAFSEFLAYKTRVPVRGAIMLNHDMDAVVLVKGWKKGANWSFPRGKINKDEPDLDCAIREVYEETGYDIHEASLVAKDENVKFIEITMREQHMRLYVFRGVLMDTEFEPKTRKEISKIQWYKLSDLPTLKKGKNQQEGKGDELANNANKFYMVAPFLNPLKKWIAQQKKLDRQKEDGHQQIVVPPTTQDRDEPIIAPQADYTISNVNISEMERLLAGLRQSGQSLGISKLPQESETMPPIAKVETPLEPMVQPTDSAMIASSTIPMASGVDREKSKALLALLKGENTGGHAQLPQPQVEQVIEHAVMPASPKNHHPLTARDRDPPLDSRLLNPPAAILTRDHVKPQWVQVSSGPHKKSTSYIPATGATSIQQADPLRPTNNLLPQPRNHVVPAPYQRTHDRTVAQASNSAGLPSSIPAASKLPPPKLTSHSSTLLDLFKSAQPVTAFKKSAALDLTPIRGLVPDPHGPSHTERGDRSSEDKVSLATLSRVDAGHHTQTFPKSSNTLSKKAIAVERTESASHERDPEPNEPATEPPKTFSVTQTEPHAKDPIVQAAVAAVHLPPSIAANRVDQPVPLRTTHLATLLDLFRKPSAPPNEVTKEAKPSLEPPATPFELSALPSPGHSREPSQVTEPPRVQPVGDLSFIVPNPQPKRTKAVLAPRKSPVSATVNGPLNVPHFDMLIKKPSVKQKLLLDNGSPEARYKAPVRILSRSAQLPNPSVPFTRNGSTQNNGTTPAPPNTIASTPAPPPFRTAPAPQHQPQILRRPPHLQASLHDSIISPIDPLPSPKHNVGRGKQTQDHKQTLLSLFNKPSPATTPNPMDLEALISPPPLESASSSIFDDNRTPTEALPSAGLERSRVGSFPSVTGDGSAKVSSGWQTPRATTTPKDRSFLLGYLEGVVRAEGR